MSNDLERLLDFTKECRPDMHEPYEKGIHAEFGPVAVMLNGTLFHTELDNANTSEMSYDMGFWLIRRERYRDGSTKETREWFNLANIIALARRAR